MNFQRKRAAIKILILCLIVGVVISAFLAVSWKERVPKLPFIRGFKSSKLVYMKGIQFVEYHGDKKVYGVSIDNFSVERARIGPFAIGPLHVAHLNKVNIDLYLDGVEFRLDKEKGVDVSEKGVDVSEKGVDVLEKAFENPISGIRKNLPHELKKIRGIELKDISVNLWKNEQRIFRISSDTATVDRKTGDIIFVGHASMDASESGKLITHRIRWDRKTHFFRITDPYILTKGQETREGNAIETDSSFTRVSYRPLEK